MNQCDISPSTVVLDNKDGACPAPSIPYILKTSNENPHLYRVAMCEIHVCLQYDKICMGNVYMKYQTNFVFAILVVVVVVVCCCSSVSIPVTQKP